MIFLAGMQDFLPCIVTKELWPYNNLFIGHDNIKKDDEWN